MEKLLPSTGEFEKEWLLEFHGVKYEVNLGTSSSVLTLDIEQEGSNDKWSAEFTSQYIEEITHKAGNFKKFDTFVMMLTSAFSRDSDTVYVDLLTYNDLELMKARKLGNSVGTNSSFQSQASATSKSQMKRYVILTYNSEFDRVHFPLPLSFEENPSIESLQRTIFRLKRREKERFEREEGQLVSVKESRDLKFIDAQLRQENTELKHRLRLAESKSNKRGGEDSFSNTESIKLKKQVEQMKRALQEKCVAYDKLKADVISMRSFSSNADGNSKVAYRDLQNRFRQVQSQLEMERIDHRKELSRLKRELADSRRTSLYGSSRSSTRRSTASTSRERDTTARHTKSQGTRSRSPLGDPSPSRSRRPKTASSTTSSTNSRVGGRGYGESSGYGQSKRPATRRPSPGTRSRNTPSPTSASRSIGRSRSPSSSLGGVFDPTAYAREKEEQRNRVRERRGRAWGAGSASNRYDRESGYNSASSGYNSATSQSSAGSARSRRSTGSTHSARSVRSQDSMDQSKTRKTSKTVKKSKSKSPSRKRKTKRDSFQNHVGIGVRGDGNGVTSALDLHQSENTKRSPQGHFDVNDAAQDILGSYLQDHDDSEIERQGEVERRKIQQLHENQQQYHLQQRHEQEQYRQEYETRQKIITSHRESYIHESSMSTQGKPPLKLSLDSSTHTEHHAYPIDDIEDDSDESDSNLDTSSEPESIAEERRIKEAVSTSVVIPNTADETARIAQLRNHLLRNVSMNDQSLHNNSLASSMTSVKSNTEYNTGASNIEIATAKGGEISTEKENYPNMMAAGRTNSREKKLSFASKDDDDDADVSDIDRRLSDLQKFLDKARSGILAVAQETNDA